MLTQHPLDIAVTSQPDPQHSLLCVQEIETQIESNQGVAMGLCKRCGPDRNTETRVGL